VAIQHGVKDAVDRAGLMGRIGVKPADTAGDTATSTWLLNLEKLTNG
jgi:hypothetical protein